LSESWNKLFKEEEKKIGECKSFTFLWNSLLGSKHPPKDSSIAPYLNVYFVVQEELRTMRWVTKKEKKSERERDTTISPRIQSI